MRLRKKIIHRIIVEHDTRSSLNETNFQSEKPFQCQRQKLIKKAKAALNTQDVM